MRTGGRLIPRALADLTVFDPDRVKYEASYEDPGPAPAGRRHGLSDRNTTERVVTAIRPALADGHLTPETVKTALAELRRLSADQSPRAGN